MIICPFARIELSIQNEHFLKDKISNICNRYECTYRWSQPYDPSTDKHFYNYWIAEIERIPFIHLFRFWSDLNKLDGVIYIKKLNT